MKDNQNDYTARADGPSGGPSANLKAQIEAALSDPRRQETFAEHRNTMAHGLLAALVKCFRSTGHRALGTTETERPGRDEGHCSYFPDPDVESLHGHSSAARQEGVPGMSIDRLVRDDVVDGIVRVVAEVAADAFRMEGKTSSDGIDLVASGSLLMALERELPQYCFESCISEGLKDRAPSLTEGLQVGRSSREDDQPIWVLSDPVECSHELADLRTERSRRASMTAVVLAPFGSIPPIDSDGYAMKIVVPPGAPTGPGGILLDTPPHQIVRILCQTFRCVPDAVEVFILDRPRHNAFIAQFTAAGANVNVIPRGDLEAALLACRPAVEDRVRILYGIGGRAEGMLAVPLARRTGAKILFQPVEKKTFRPVQSGPWFTYDTDSLITSDDCLLAVAGITDAPESSLSELVPPISCSPGRLYVHVLVASPSPLLSEARIFQVAVSEEVVTVKSENRSDKPSIEVRRLLHRAEALYQEGKLKQAYDQTTLALKLSRRISTVDDAEDDSLRRRANALLNRVCEADDDDTYWQWEDDPDPLLTVV